jgi:hypothetical protein
MFENNTDVKEPTGLSPLPAYAVAHVYYWRMYQTAASWGNFYLKVATMRIYLI